MGSGAGRGPGFPPGTTIDCYVLDTDARVLSLRTVVKTLTGIDGGQAADYWGIKPLKPFLPKDFSAAGNLEFLIPGNPVSGHGITAEQFMDICGAYVSTLLSNASL